MRLFGEKLKDVRKKNGISVNYIVKKLNISRKAYWNWENDRAVPTGNIIRELAKIIGMPVSLISDLSDNRHLSSNRLDQYFEGINNEHVEQGNLNCAFEIINKTMASLQKQYQQNSAVINVMLNSVNAMFYVKDLDLKFISANEFFINMFSASSQLSFSGKTDMDFFTHIEAKENSEEDKQVLLTGKPIINKENYIPGTRKKRWGLISKFPILDANSKVMGIVGTFIDITQRKKHEEKRKKLEYIVNNLNEGIWFRALDSVGEEKIYLNPAVERITGIKASEFYKDPFINKKYYHPDFEKKLDDFEKIDKYPKQIDYKIIRASDKEERWVRQIEYQKDNLAFGIEYDITEQKNNEEIRDLLKIYMDIAKAGISIMNIDTMTFMYVNEACEKIYGRNKEEIMKGGYQFWINNCVYNEDIKLFSDIKDSKTLLDFDMKHSVMKYRIIKPDGEIRPIYSEISATIFKGNNCSLYIEYDISDEKCSTTVF